MSKSTKQVFITGGSGFVGAHLIPLTVRQGLQVRALARSEQAAAKVRSAGAEPVRGDLADEEALRAGLAGCDAVFHLAAYFKLWGPKREFYHGNVEGTRTLMKAAREAGVGTFIQLGAAAVVMGNPEPMIDVDETMPRQRRAWAPYSASKAEAEELVLNANVEGAFRTIVVRPPMIWGAGMPMLDHVAELAASGRFPFIDGGKQAMSTAHVDNVCHALLLAEQRGRGGQAYFISDGLPRRQREVMSALLATRGIAEPKRNVPFAVAWALARPMEWTWRLLDRSGEPPITRQMLRLIGKDFTLNTTRARTELGYEPVRSWEEGLAAMRAANRPALVGAAGVHSLQPA